EIAGSAGDALARDAWSAVGDDVVPAFDPARPEQHPATLTLGSTRDVGALVDAVAEVDVQVTGVPEHHLVARRPARPRVRGRIRSTRAQQLPALLGVSSVPAHSADASPDRSISSACSSSSTSRASSTNRTGIPPSIR